jgi:hypothetical protein
VGTSASFAAWHNQVEGRLELGFETFANVPAHRYRLTQTHETRSLYEMVLADDLFAQLSELTWLQFPNDVLEKRLSNVRRNEPDPQLFEIPVGDSVERVS